MGIEMEVEREYTICMLYANYMKNKQRITRTIRTLAITVMLQVFCACIFFTAVAAEDRFPNVSAQSAVVLDCSSERLLYEKNSDKRMKIASTTKIMTAILILENCDLDEIVEITTEHYAEGSSMYLREGEKVSVRDLLYGLMLMSGNDAA